MNDGLISPYTEKLVRRAVWAHWEFLLGLRNEAAALSAYPGIRSVNDVEDSILVGIYSRRPPVICYRFVNPQLGSKQAVLVDIVKAEGNDKMILVYPPREAPEDLIERLKNLRLSRQYISLSVPFVTVTPPSMHELVASRRA